MMDTSPRGPAAGWCCRATVRRLAARRPAWRDRVASMLETAREGVVNGGVSKCSQKGYLRSMGVIVGCYGLCRGMWIRLAFLSTGRVWCRGWSAWPPRPAPALMVAVRVAGPLRRKPTCRNITSCTLARSRSFVSTVKRASPGRALSRRTWLWSTSRPTTSAPRPQLVSPGYLRCILATAALLAPLRTASSVGASNGKANLQRLIEV